MRGNPTHDAKGRFARQYHGCKVEGCKREHNSKGFCRRHLKAFNRGRIDAEGKPIPLRCQLCGVLNLPQSAQSRFCPNCRPRWIRQREKAWKEQNRPIVRIKIRAWKRRHPCQVRQRERTRTRLRRARLRVSDPTRYRQQLASHARRQKSLQELSLQFLRRAGRWSERETELLRKLYPRLGRGDGWQRLFEILGRSYVSIRGKWQAVCRAKRGAHH